MSGIRVSDEVAAALAAGAPVVALETSIVAQGLPQPFGLEAGLACEAAVRSGGAVPATTAVVDGVLRVGLLEAELRALATAGSTGGAAKVSTRDLGAVCARGGSGATTVAAAVRMAALAGIRVMATGGIGGVHRGDGFDVSTDLGEIARSPVAVVCAGAKMILDLPRTLEVLETLGVPVFGFRCSEFPAFYTAISGLPVSVRVEDAAACASALAAGWSIGLGGAVVAVPPPRELGDAAAIVARAVTEVTARGVTGSAVTPAVLSRVAELTRGRSVEVNIDLVVNNSRVAAEIAKALAGVVAR